MQNETLLNLIPLLIVDMLSNVHFVYCNLLKVHLIYIFFLLKQHAINLSFFFWQVVRGLLALNNEHAVQIDSHDTLWGETGMFSSIILRYAALLYYHQLFLHSEPLCYN